MTDQIQHRAGTYLFYFGLALLVAVSTTHLLGIAFGKEWIISMETLGIMIGMLVGGASMRKKQHGADQR